MRFKEVYKRLNGREATTEQVLKFERLVASLETTPGDAMLAILVALDYYENLYSDIPAKISKSSTEVLAEFKLAAEKTAGAAFKETQAINASALVDIANKVAGEVSTTRMYQWGFGSMAVATLLVTLMAWYMHSSGFEAGMAAGKAAGYEQAKNQISAAAWANTPQGAQAYRLAQTGELDRLSKCTGKGWTLKKNVCYVHAVEGEGIYGWRVP
jgi:hypothetical protein